MQTPVENPTEKKTCIGKETYLSASNWNHEDTTFERDEKEYLKGGALVESFFHQTTHAATQTEERRFINTLQQNEINK